MVAFWPGTFSSTTDVTRQEGFGEDRRVPTGRGELRPTAGGGTLQAPPLRSGGRQDPLGAGRATSDLNMSI